MGKSFSTYLDVLRFTAAVLVVFEHAALLGLLPPLGVATELSHESVIVFFVLSGLVIASSSWSRQTTARAYIASRTARVLSVSLPAVLCCFGASLLWRAGAAPGSMSAFAAQFTSSALFMNGVWANYVDVPFDAPYWSLCHEVWYYGCWGVLRFATRPRVRASAATIVFVAMGPAFAALFGLWMMGALVAAWQPRFAAATRRVPRWLMRALVVASVLGIVLLAGSSIQESVRAILRAHVHGWWRMRSAEYVVTDYVIGLLIAAHLVAAACLFGDARRFAESRLGRLARYCAGFTFTLYLFHYPMLLALSAIRAPRPPSLAAGFGSIAVTLAGVWIVAFATERQLPRWRRLAQTTIEFVSRGRTATRPASVAPVTLLSRG